MLLNCGVGEDSWEQADSKETNCPLESKAIKPVNPKGNQPSIFIGRTDTVMQKLQYFGHLMWRADSIEKTLILGRIDGRRRRGWQDEMDGIIPTRWTWAWANSRRWWWTGKPGMLQSMGSQWVRQDWVTEEQQQIVRLRREFWRSVVPQEIYYFYSRVI